MSFSMRWEQCCESEGCTRPAHHGTLCASCFMAATPARRAAELLAADAVAPDAVLPRGEPLVSVEGETWLRLLWAA